MRRSQRRPGRRYGSFRAGGVFGLVSGYAAADVIPLVALIVAYDGKRFGANLIATRRLVTGRTAR
jgi:hypothetical protein